MKRKKSGEKRRTPSAVAALGGKPIEIARIDGDAEAWLAVFADRIAVATDKETEERHWFEFERATWSGNTLTMPFVDWNIPAFELKLADGEENIALVVRERLERSIVVRRSAKLPSGAEVRAMVRRDDKDDLFTQVIIDGRAKEEDEEAIAELEETLRDIVGLEPDGDDGRGASEESSTQSALPADDADSAGPQTPPEGSGPQTPPEGSKEAQAEMEAVEKSQTSAEADVASPESLAAEPAKSVEGAEAAEAPEVAEAAEAPEAAEDAEFAKAAAPETVEAAEAVNDAGADGTVGSASEPVVGLSAAAQAADGAVSSEASESDASSAGASDAPSASAVPEGAPALSQEAAAPKSEPEPEVLTPPDVDASPGASDGLANPTAAANEEGSADASSNLPKDGLEQPSAADPATNARAETSADAAEATSPASATESDAEKPAPAAGTTRGSEPKAPERGSASSS